MRGSDQRTDSLFSYVSCEARVPENHPLRPIRAIVDEALEVMSPEFEGMYAKVGLQLFELPKGSPNGCCTLSFRTDGVGLLELANHRGRAATAITRRDW